MNKTALIALSEKQLNTLVSIAIRRAEVLDDAQSPAASEVWREVMAYEERLAEIIPADDITGGVARAGAVSAALSAGDRLEAERLAGRYLAESSLPAERRAAIERAFREDMERLAERFPALARSGRLAELHEWRANRSITPPVFPRAA
jgi:hypothetical protein